MSSPAWEPGAASTAPARRRERLLGGGTCALLLDLDDFKKVNDSLGHRHGDRLLVEVATRIRAVLRPGERAIRLGRDEFVVFVGHGDAAEATATADRLLLALEAPVRVAETELTIGASLGIAMGHTQGDLDSLLGAADVAMYTAKKRGKGMAVTFEPYMQQAAQERLSVESDLRRAVCNHRPAPGLPADREPQDRCTGRGRGARALEGRRTR